MLSQRKRVVYKKKFRKAKAQIISVNFRNPRKKIFHDYAEFQTVYLALQGRYTLKAISNYTGLTIGQVAYRLRDLEIKMSQIRNPDIPTMQKELKRQPSHRDHQKASTTLYAHGYKHWLTTNI